MSNLQHGPKARCLQAKETGTTLESWKANIIYGLRLNPDFRQYLNPGVVFGAKNRHYPLRDLTDICERQQEDDGKGGTKEVLVIVKSRQERCNDVDLMLEQIANYAPNVPRSDIVRDCGSLAEVWKVIKQFYNQQESGSLLNDAFNIRREVDESPQALFARMKQAFSDNLLKVDGLFHVGGQAKEEEEMSPTLHNMIILHWLQALHPGLRDLVTSRFVTQLKDHTYAAIFPEISRTVEALLEELNNDTAVNRVFNKPNQGNYPNNPSSRFNPSSFQYSSSKPFYKPSYSSSYKPNYKSNYNPSGHNHSQSSSKHCDFCKLTGKKMFYTHNINECLFVKRMNKSAAANQVYSDDVDQHYEEFYQFLEEEESLPQASCLVEHIINQVNIDASPVLELQRDDVRCDVTLDTGATCNLIKEKKARDIRAKITPTSQKVRMADGTSPLDVVGETEITLFRNNKPYVLSAIVCRNTDTEILAGMPFMKTNDVAVRPYSDEIILGGTEFVKYDPRRISTRSARRLTVQLQERKVILPGEAVTVKLAGVTGDIAVEPRWDFSFNKFHKNSLTWPVPQTMEVNNNEITLQNTSPEPVVIHKAEPICNIYPANTSYIPTNDTHLLNQVTLPKTLPEVIKTPKLITYSKSVNLNPDKVLSNTDETSFRELLTTYDQVFSPVDSTYNGQSGPCYVHVNIGPNKPPQRNGHVPFYGDEGLKELQDKFDNMKQRGMLSRPEEVGVIIENVNPSFMVNKQPPSLDKRLVTDFKSIASYCRPSPSLLPDVETTLRRIASFKHLIKTDMTEAYRQIKVKHESKKYCGVHTPFKGLLVYNVGCMGLPGVEVALEELTCLILGTLVKEGKVCKLADDLFIGGSTPEELKENFQLVLQKFLENNIKLSPTKTVIAPKSVTILGWTWTSGQLKASSHKLSALASCPPPATVTALRSYLGAYRFISRLIKGYANLLTPLEELVKGKEPKDSIQWSEEQLIAFQKSKDALAHSKTITIPRPSDSILIVTDASVRPGAVGATMYVIRDNKTLLAGYFNSKLPEFKKRWLPCELEGLSIAAALNHFSPYLINSSHYPRILTDSKPCVDAVNKLKKGVFPTSARLSTFISAASRYNADVRHIPGSMNLVSDYASRHPLKCEDPEKCTVCKFIAEEMSSVVQTISVEDVLEGRAKLPWTNRNVWREIQDECSTLRKVKFFRKRGTNPNKKSKNMKQVRRYLSAGTILAHDDILINPMTPTLGPVRERIVVPDQVLHGFLTALHLTLKHPTTLNLTKAFSRYFYAPNSDKVIQEMKKACSQCAAIEDLPTAMIQESSEPPPSIVGGRFAADIMKRHSQVIFCIRETVTSYTLADLIPNETAETVADILVKQCNLLRPSSTAQITIRLDPAPAHQTLFNTLKSSNLLTRSNIKIELGRTLNKNKNPVIDKGMRELIREILILKPEGGQVSQLILSQAVANLNSRYRGTGLSAQEMWTQRDQVSGEQLPIADRDLIIHQYSTRDKNHPHSQKAKAHGKPPRPTAEVKVGTLVFVHTDRSKLHARQRYLVTQVSGNMVKLRRFSENLISHKEYDATLQEVYKVPSIDECVLPSDETSYSSDDDETQPQKARENTKPVKKKSIPKLVETRENPTVLVESPSSNDDTEDELDPYPTDEAETDEEKEESNSTDSDKDDKTWKPTVEVTPAKMGRPQRKTSVPKRFGDYVQQLFSAYQQP